MKVDFDPSLVIYICYEPLVVVHLFLLRFCRGFICYLRSKVQNMIGNVTSFQNVIMTQVLQTSLELFSDV